MCAQGLAVSLLRSSGRLGLFDVVDNVIRNIVAFVCKSGIFPEKRKDYPKWERKD